MQIQIIRRTPYPVFPLFINVSVHHRFLNRTARRPESLPVEKGFPKHSWLLDGNVSEPNLDKPEFQIAPKGSLRDKYQT